MVQSEDSRSTALHEAAAANSGGCVQVLLAAGARLDLVNGSGETPFDCTHLHDIKRWVAGQVTSGQVIERSLLPRV